MNSSGEILRCPTCKCPLSRGAGGGFRCVSCENDMPQRDGILDLLGDPCDAIQTELRGLAKENGVDLGAVGFDGVKFLRVEDVETMSVLMDTSRTASVQYYQQTCSAYLEALGRAQVDAHMKVAEIGAERTLWKLRIIEDLCDEAFALNIFFHVGAKPLPATKALRVLGDMNDLPFMSASLDLLVFSATLHHSSDLECALLEAARVLRPGARAIVVNEPIAGAAKRLGGPVGHDRDEDIHEDEVSFRSWRRAILRSGLVADEFIPSWFIGQLRGATDLPTGTRFARLGSALAPLMRHAALADIVRATGRIPAQAVLGLPLNAVLWKPQ